MKHKLLVIFFSFNFFFLLNSSISSEIEVYKKIDLFGEVLEKIWSELIPKEKVII